MNSETNFFGDLWAALCQGEIRCLRFSACVSLNFTSRMKFVLEYEIKNGARIYVVHENHWTENLWLTQRITTTKNSSGQHFVTAIAVVVLLILFWIHLVQYSLYVNKIFQEWLFWENLILQILIGQQLKFEELCFLLIEALGDSTLLLGFLWGGTEVQSVKGPIFQTLSCLMLGVLSIQD